MTDLLRVGATAVPVVDAEAQVQLRDLVEAVAGSPLERAEADELVDGYRRGHWRPVRLELFADVLGDDGRVQRFDSVHVEGVWFKVPHGPDNVRHAREAADQSLDRLQAHLAEKGFEVATGQLETVPFILELDQDLGESV